MGRPKLNRSEEETKRLRQQYYQFHREDILRKAKERREHPNNPKEKVRTESALQRLLNEWNEELSRKIEETPLEWLKIAFRDQITTNKAMFINQDERQQQNKTGRKPNL